MAGTRTIGIGELEALIAAALVASNTSVANAASVARALAQAEIDGQKGHGLSRVPIYAAQARAGKVDGHATPTVRQTRPGSLMIDVANGFVFPAVDLAVAHLPPMAGATGIAAAGFVRSHHFGVVGRHVERLAEVGLLALAFANTPKAMAPWGGRQPVFGTNPLAFAAPQRSEPPIVVDLALSQVARGKILTAAQKGEPIPAGWAVDDEGNPTTDAKVALKGALQPIGGAKGAALALMVEVLAVALTGARFSSEASSFFDAEGAAARRRPAHHRHRSGCFRRSRGLPRPPRRPGARDRGRYERPAAGLATARRAREGAAPRCGGRREPPRRGAGPSR